MVKIENTTCKFPDTVWRAGDVAQMMQEAEG